MGSVAKNVTVSLGFIAATVRVESALYTQDYLSNCCTGNGEHDPIAVSRPLTCSECGPITMHGLRKARKENGGLVLLEDHEVAELKEDGQPFFGKVALIPYDSGEVLANTSEAEKLYYLAPMTSPENLSLIKQVILAYPNKLFVAKYTVRTKASLFVATVKNDCILLSERVFRDRLKPLPSYDVPANEAYIPAAIHMVESMDVTFDEATFADTYTRALVDITRDRPIVGGKTEKTAPQNPKITADLVRQSLMEYRLRQGSDSASLR
jgi:non-homologous end joining protein Ku